MKKRSELRRTAPSHCQGAKALPAEHHGKVDHFTVPPSFASTHFCRRLLVAGLHSFLIKKQREDSNCCPRLSLLIHLVFFYGFDLLEFPFRPFCWSGLVQVARRNPAILRTKVFPTSSNFRRSRRSSFALPLGMLCCMEEYTGRVQTFR